MSQTDNNFRGKKTLNKLRQCSREWQFRTLFYTSESRERHKGVDIKSTGDRLGRWEKAKWGREEPLGLDKR